MSTESDAELRGNPAKNPIGGPSNAIGKSPLLDRWWEGLVTSLCAVFAIRSRSDRTAYTFMAK